MNPRTQEQKETGILWLPGAQLTIPAMSVAAMHDKYKITSQTNVITY